MTDSSNLDGLSKYASGVTWTFTGVATMVFVMGITSSIYHKDRGTGPEIWIFVISWILNTARQAFYQVALGTTQHLGPGQHMTSKKVASAAFWWQFASYWQMLSTPVPKLGIGFLLIRVFRPHRWLKITILTSCLILNVMFFVDFLISWLRCFPTQAIYEPARYPNAHCFDKDAELVYSIVISAFSALMDLFFAIYPAMVISQLQFPISKKITSSILMGLSLMSFIFSIVKIIYMKNLFGVFDLYESSYINIYVDMWNGLENDFILTAGCLPSSPPFYRACKRHLKQCLRPLGFSFYGDKDQSPSSYESKCNEKCSECGSFDAWCSSDCDQCLEYQRIQSNST